MAQTASIDLIKARHEELYDRALEQAPNLRRALAARPGLGERPSTQDESQAFLGEVNKLLANLTNLSAQVSSFEDYRWLSHAAIKWQNVFSFLDSPKFVKLSPPSGDLLPPTDDTATTVDASLSEEELDYWIKTHAQTFAYTRIAERKRISTEEERDRDYHLAYVYLSSDILDGKINFVKRIAPRSYERLELVWMEDLKCLRAYLLWLQRGGGWGLSAMERNYFDVCDHLRFMLTNFEMKAIPAEFEPVRRFLKEKYLTRGKIAPALNEWASWLIGHKAYRLFEQTGKTDAQQNWDDAETYVRTFYESITPAVMDGDRECTLRVLRALQCERTAHRSSYHMISAFEAALATYFLRPDLIQSIWNDCKLKPSEIHTPIISEIKTQRWPSAYVAPSACQGLFEVGDHVIRFRGVMSEGQKDALLHDLAAEHQPAINSLFARTRTVCREFTL